MKIKEKIKDHLDSISDNDKDIEKAKEEIAKHQRIKDFAEKSNVWYRVQIDELSILLTKIEKGEIFEFDKTYSRGEFSYTFKYEAKKISNIKGTSVYTEYTIRCVMENARRKIVPSQGDHALDITWKEVCPDNMVYEVEFISEGTISNFTVDENIQLLFKENGYNIPFDELKDNNHASRSR